MKIQKPGSAAFNNSIKFGLDVLDQPARQYSTKSASRKCLLHIFFIIIIIIFFFSFFFFFFLCILHRKYAQHVRGQVTKLFPYPIWINIFTQWQPRYSSYKCTDFVQGSCWKRNQEAKLQIWWTNFSKTTLCRRDEQQFLTKVHLHQVPGIDSVKLLNVETLKLTPLAFYAKWQLMVLVLVIFK